MPQRRQLSGARHVFLPGWVGRLRLQHASVQVTPVLQKSRCLVRLDYMPCYILNLFTYVLVRTFEHIFFTGGRYPPVAQGCHNVEFEHIVQGQLPPSTLYEPCARYKMPSRWGKSHVAQRRCLFRPRPRWLQGPKRGRRCNICPISTLWRFLPCTRYLQGCGGARPLHNGGVPSTRAATGFAPTTSCLLYTSPSPRDRTRSRMPSSA